MIFSCVQFSFLLAAWNIQILPPRVRRHLASSGTWGQGEVVSLRSLPDYKVDQRNILTISVAQGLMELMQPLLQLWPMPLLVFP